MLSNLDSYDSDMKHHSENACNVVNKTTNIIDTGTSDFALENQNNIMDENNDNGKQKCTQNMYEKNDKCTANNTVVSDDSVENNDKGKQNCTQNMYGENNKCTANNTVVSVESDKKYDLELRFKPRHRQQIGEAKNNQTFQSWDNQMRDKYRFIPLSDLLVPKTNKKNKPISDIKVLHETIKFFKKFNFMQAQIQVPSQLNPDVWDEYLSDYWDKQLCF